MLNAIAVVVCALCAVFWVLKWNFLWAVLGLIAAVSNVPASVSWIRNRLWWRKYNKEHRKKEVTK